MKTKHIRLGGLIFSLACLSSCNHLPLYSKSKLDKVAVKERYKGFHEGRAGELRRQTHQRQRQKEQALPEPATKWFSVPVDAHVNADGVRIDAHSRPVKIVQP